MRGQVYYSSPITDLAPAREWIMPDKKEPNLETLKKIIQIMKDDDLTEVCIEQNDLKIQVRRAGEQPSAAVQGAAILTDQQEIVVASGLSGAAEELVVVPSPMVGTFYRAPSPDVEPYVNVGDSIKAGQVICVVEAMKLMNEITSDLDGEIVDILAEDGQPVEYDQPIFRVKPRK